MFLTKNLHPKEITIWVALCMQGLISLIFIEKNADSPVYRKILRKEAFPSSRRWKHFWNFGTWLIWPWIRLKLTSRSAPFWTIFRSKKRGLELAAVQPNLSPLDYFLRGCVKDRCYANNFGSEKKHHNIFDLLWENPGIFSLVTRNFQRRLERIVEWEGGHIENVII